MKKEINYVAKKEEWKEAQEKELNKVTKKVKIDGFRPGKAPRDMVMKKYGADIMIDAANSLIDKEYRRIILEDKIIPVVEPKIELVKSTEDELEVKFTFITTPTVKLGEYKNLGIKKDAVKVSKKEIDEREDAILKDYAELTIKDKGNVESGDIAIIDFEGFKDGVAFDGGKGENYSLEIGSNTFIPGFEDGIIGMKKGETKDLDLSFPDNYGVEDLKGAKVVFKVKVNEIKTKVVPELDKEFFDDLGMDGVTNKEEFDAKVKEDLKNEKDRQAENKFIDSLIEKAVSNMKVEIDDEIIDAESQAMYREMVNNMTMQGISEEMYLQYANTTKEDIIKSLRDEALRRLKSSYLLQNIIKAEKIESTDDEAKAEVSKLATQYNMTDEDVIKSIGSLEDIKYELCVRKAIDVMKGNE